MSAQLEIEGETPPPPVIKCAGRKKKWASDAERQQAARDAYHKRAAPYKELQNLDQTDQLLSVIKHAEIIYSAVHSARKVKDTAHNRKIINDMLQALECEAY